MTVPFYSVVMPAYNCEDTIGATIMSILGQSFTDFELIIVNDGSTDTTEAVIRQYNDERVQLITVPNNGPGNARNVGISKAQGTYLILVDSDDQLESENFANRAQYFLNNRKLDLLIGSYQTIVMDDQEEVDRKQILAPDMELDSKEQFLEEVYNLMEQQFMYVIWNKVYRLDLIKKHQVKFPPYRSCEDRLFNLQYFHHVNHIQVTSEIVYHYSFDGKNSLTNKYFDNKYQTFEEFYLKSVELVPEDLPGFSSLFLKGTMSCFMPLHSHSCVLDTRGKRHYIQVALDSPYLKQAAKKSISSGMMKKIFKVIFNIPNVTFHYAISWILYKLSNVNPKVIEKLKRNF